MDFRKKHKTHYQCRSFYQRKHQSGCWYHWPKQNTESKYHLKKKNSKEDSRKVLATHIPREGLKDEIEWIHIKAGDYTIKSGYWFLNHKTEGLEENAKFWKYIWNSDIFSKWKHFIWKILLKALPIDNLIKRSIKNVDPYCTLYRKNKDSLSYLFRDNEVSKRIWCTTLGIRAIKIVILPYRIG